MPDVGVGDPSTDQYRAALDAGANPATVAEWITQAETAKATARAQLATASVAARTTLTADQIQHMIADLGNLTDDSWPQNPTAKPPSARPSGSH